MLDILVELAVVELILLHIELFPKLLLQADQVLLVLDVGAVDFHQELVALLLQHPLQEAVEFLWFDLPFERIDVFILV